VIEDEEHKIKGFLLAWKFNMAGFGHSVDFGWLDCVHTYRLDKKEAIGLVRYFCKSCHDLGWKGIQSPFIPYFDAKPFLKSKFRFFPKKLIIQQFSPEKLDLPLKTESLYFDWR
jgi:hypothetical protein